jgi:hypothetical protein
MVRAGSVYIWLGGDRRESSPPPQFREKPKPCWKDEWVLRRTRGRCDYMWQCLSGCGTDFCLQEEKINVALGWFLRGCAFKQIKHFRNSGAFTKWLLVCDSTSLCNLGWPQTHNPPTSASQPGTKWFYDKMAYMEIVYADFLYTFWKQSSFSEQCSVTMKLPLK